MSSMRRSRTAEPHTACHQFVIRRAAGTSQQPRSECRKPRQRLGFLVVAGAGFEPATFGL